MKFDSEFLTKLEYLSLVSKRIFRGQLLARKRTRQLGGGVEFADHRDYALGDDLRHLDWNVYARLGSRLIKRFEKEEDLHVYFLLDCSRSMAVGEPSKFDYARQLTAALAYIALADLDRISVVPFADEIYDVFPLTRGKQHVLSLFRFLESLETVAARTNLTDCVREFVHRKQRSGLAVILSDLFDPAGFQQAVNLLRYKRYEPNLIQIHDRSEAAPRLRGDIRIVDIETEAAIDVTINENALHRYKAVFAEFLDSIKRYCIGYGLGGTIVRTEIPFDELILDMMRQSGQTDLFFTGLKSSSMASHGDCKVVFSSPLPLGEG